MLTDATPIEESVVEVEEVVAEPEAAETPSAPVEDMSFMFNGSEPVEPKIEEEVAPKEVEETPETPQGSDEPEVVTPEAAVPSAIEQEIQALRANQQELMDYIKSLQAGKAEETPKEEELTLETVEFVKTDEDIRNFLDTPEGFNKLLNQIYSKGAAKGRELALQSIPEIAQTEARSLYDRRQLVANFYMANPDLAPHSQLLKQRAIELSDKKTFNSYAELLEATEKSVREEKGLVRAVSKPVAKPAAKQPLSFPGGNGGAGRRPAAAALTQAQKDMQDLLY